MIEDTLSKMLKGYVNIFINEYKMFLSSEKLNKLENINYQNIIKFEKLNAPFGDIIFDKIYLSCVNSELINSLSSIDNFNTKKYNLNNNNLSSYLKYMCDNGYDLLEYSGDILMYFVFKLVISDDSGFTNGLINQEIKYLSIKYSIRCANLYAREEKIISQITHFLKLYNCRKILFMDRVSRFKYLSENLGYRYANLVSDVEKLIEKEYSKLNEKNINKLEEFIDYTDKYDHLSYGDVYNYLLDFMVENKIKS